MSTPTLFHFRIQRAGFDENFYSAEKTLIQKWEDGEIDLNGAFFFTNTDTQFNTLFPSTLSYSESREDTSAFSRVSLIILRMTHLTPGGGVPVETRLKVTGHLALWPGGHGPAVERS